MTEPVDKCGTLWDASHKSVPQSRSHYLYNPW
jgi:hypothetical protein